MWSAVILLLNESTVLILENWVSLPWTVMGLRRFATAIVQQLPEVRKKGHGPEGSGRSGGTRGCHESRSIFIRSAIRTNVSGNSSVPKD